ncbi:hypothetical protein F7734_07110 [Scytonema sp. UIC 10036]|uniref:hypothetical protein n=1 Tax=Scytonema sp. UIC 10036 TaxID=2304196 RepID=UPI0012DA8F92|nr:hypothetical protein [Scytonema sp. UIC 10036]MUG92239.1 hypothetical protein [Scytonema sp. UIC 10036]
MNKKLVLNLLSSSTIFTSLMSTLAVINPAHAATTTQRLLHTNDGRTCISHPHGSTSFVCIKASQSQQASATNSSTVTVGISDSNVAMLDFTEEESNSAIQLFGCDCPYCINSLRQLRGTGNLVY